MRTCFVGWRHSPRRVCRRPRGCSRGSAWTRIGLGVYQREHAWRALRSSTTPLLSTLGAARRHVSRQLSATDACPRSRAAGALCCGYQSPPPTFDVGTLHDAHGDLVCSATDPQRSMPGAAEARQRTVLARKSDIYRHSCLRRHARLRRPQTRTAGVRSHDDVDGCEVVLETDASSRRYEPTSTSTSLWQSARTTNEVPQRSFHSRGQPGRGTRTETASNSSGMGEKLRDVADLEKHRPSSSSPASGTT